MNIRAENRKRIRELEAEFTDEKLAEVFVPAGGDRFFVSGRQGRITGRVLLKRLIIVVIVIVAIIVLLQFFAPMVAAETSLEGFVMERDCIVVAKHGSVRVGDIVAFKVRDTYDNGGIHTHFGRVTSFSGDVVEIEGDGADGRARYVATKEIEGRALFRVFPLTRGGAIS